jgi:hypothetical protein
MAAFVGTSILLAAGRPVWLPLLFLIWANLHGAVAVGLVAIAGAGAAELVRERRVPWTLVAVAGLCGLATLITPLGTALWSFIPASMERSRINQLIEWQPPGADVKFWPFWGLAAALPIATVWRWRALDPFTARLAGVALATLPIAIQAMRNVPLFLLMALPALTRIIERQDESPVRRAPRGERVAVNASVLGAAAVVAAGVVGLGWAAPAPRLGWEPISPAAVAGIRGCQNPVYNTYGDGGVLIWFVRDRPVFIDNRQDPYPMDLLRANRRAEVTGDYRSLFDTYGVRCVAVPTTSLLAARLREDTTWAERYADHQWTVFTPDPRTVAAALQPAP